MLYHPFNLWNRIINIKPTEDRFPKYTPSNMCRKITLLHRCAHHVVQVYLCDAVRLDPLHKICSGNSLLFTGIATSWEVCCLCKENRVANSLAKFAGPQEMELSVESQCHNEEAQFMEMMEKVENMDLDGDPRGKREGAPSPEGRRD